MLLQVDDCIAKFLYMKGMTAKVKQLKDEGKPMPKDYQQLEREFGETCYSARFVLQCPASLLLTACHTANMLCNSVLSMLCMKVHEFAAAHVCCQNNLRHSFATVESAVTQMALKRYSAFFNVLLV